MDKQAIELIRSLINLEDKYDQIEEAQYMDVYDKIIIAMRALLEVVDCEEAQDE
jgi:hypothetical protein